MAETLQVEARELRGKRNNRRLRAGGMVPAVLYGHGKEVVSLSVPADALDTAIRHGSRMVSLAGAVNESAFIRECQWDTWGNHVVHVDFTRISEHEKVQVQVTIELRGEAPGVKAGGTVKHAIHELDLECEAGSIPEKISLSINNRELDGTITVADLELPAGAQALVDGSAIVVQCTEVAEQAEEEAGDGAEAEPEVIGRKKEDEEAES